MGSGFYQGGGDPSGRRISIDESQFVDLVAAKAADRVEPRLARRIGRRRAGALWLAALLGLIAISGVGAVAFFDLKTTERLQDAKIVAAVSKAVQASGAGQSQGLRGEVDRAVAATVARAVEEKIDAKVAALIARLDGMALHQQFLTLSLQLELKDSFSDEDRDQVLAILVQLNKRGGYADRPGFIRGLKKIVDSFTSAYQVAAIDTIDDLFRQDLTRMEDVPRWLTNHFGRVLVTSRDINERSSKVWQRLRYYSNVAKQNRNPEVSLLWNMLAQYVLSNERKSLQVDGLVAQIGHLSDKDRQVFLRSLLEEGTASEREPADMRRLAEIVTSFIVTYKEELAGFGLEVE